ncbi:alpha/beta hydrolase [Leucobacter sp. CX328]|uniref:alpha/beta hydrolase n=1 Tax=unclassified Leucobacter TaxID=2621730 RepID=UPI00333F9758
MSEIDNAEDIVRQKSKRFRLIVTVVVGLLIAGLIALLISGGFGQPVVQQKPGSSDFAPPKGDVEQTLAGYQSQEPDWRNCGDGFQCATVLAPLNWNDLESEPIELAMIRKPATGSNPLGSLFINPGGPGASGVEYARYAGTNGLDDVLLKNYDIIGWDPRGVGNSSAIDCFTDAELDEQLFGFDDSINLKRGSDEWLQASEESARTIAEACEKNSGDLIKYVSTDETVQDLDMMRAIVGDEQLNYLGYSYGTYIGARYADRFPENAGRLVLDGAIDPQVTEREMIREQTKGFELALRAYVTDCLTRSDCPFTGTVDEAMKQIGDMLDQVDAEPLQASDGRYVGSSTLLTAIITPLYNQDNWSYLDMLFQAIPQGDPDIALALADSYYSRDADGSYLDNSTVASWAINCLDYPTDADVESMRAEAAELEKLAPTIGRFQTYGGTFCADWPGDSTENREPVSAKGANPILVIGTTGDPATPYLWAEALADQLESGVLVTFKGEGHTAYGTSSCASRVIDEFLVEGTVPAQDPLCTE